MAARYSHELVHTLREFCGAVYGAQCLVRNGELGPRVSALMRYASTLLDAIDVQLLETGLPPDADELASAGRLRERFERLLLMLVTMTLRELGAHAATAKAPRQRKAGPGRRPARSR
ncbi:MAG: hypothetical protein U1F15_15340 [Burkholderiales bacterium]